MYRANMILTLLALAALLAGACQPLIRTSEADLDADALRPIGHVCGAATTIAVEGKLALLGLSYELVLLDITDPSQPEWRSALPISVDDLIVHGDYLYAAGRAGLTIVDIAELSAPIVVSAVPTIETATGVAVVAPYAYLVDLTSLWVVNITDPTHPAVASSLQVAGGIKDLEIDGAYAYMATHSGLHVVDVTDPHRPTPAGFFSTRLSAQELVLDGAFAYLADYETLYLLDLATPSAPREVTRFPLAGLVGRMRRVEELLYVANGEFGLRVFSIASPDHVVELTAYPSAGLALDVWVEDGYVYVVGCDEGLRILAADPIAQWVEVGAFESLGIVFDIAVERGYLYALSGWNNTLHLIAVDDPAQAQAHVHHLFPEGVYGFSIVDERAYLATESGLHIYDMQTPAAPALLAHVPASCEAVTVAGRYGFISNAGRDLLVVDLARPKPAVIQRYRAWGNADKLVVAGDLAYLVDPRGDVRIVAIGETGDLAERSLLQLPTPAVRLALLDRNWLVVATHAMILVVDVADPTIPIIVAAYPVAAHTIDLVVENRYLYVANMKYGIQLFDAADPRHLREVGVHPVPGGAYRLAVRDGTVYIAGGFGGVTILSHEADHR